jgi:hypothetical protein
MVGLGERVVLWEKMVESNVIWLQQAESINHWNLLWVTNKAVEDWDKTWWIKSFTLAAVREVDWDGVSGAEEAEEATAAVY